MKKVILKIGGMSCSACSNGLEKYLNKQEGIIGASVNLIMNNATIEYDETLLTLNDLEKFVSRSGFESLGIDDFKRGKKEEKKKKVELIIISIIFAISFIYHILEMLNIAPLDQIISGALIGALSIVTIVFGFDIIKSGIISIKVGSPSMDTLVLISVVSSFLYSIYGYILTILGDNKTLYFASCIMVIFFVKMGRYIETKAKNRTTSAISDLMLLTPSYANLLVDGKIKKVTIDEVQKGDILVTRGGESIAVDGEVISGNALINESLITGESMPKTKLQGDKVIAGAVSLEGYIEYKAERIGKESTVSEIVRTVVEATNSKTKIQRIADIFSKYFVYFVILVALVGFTIWLIISRNFQTSINVFVTVLVVACPCALGLATPIALVVSSGTSAKLGILVKDNSVFEILPKTKTVIFDKTGTLTTGELELVGEVYFDYDSSDAFSYIASLEEKSLHPIAKAVIRASKEKGIDAASASEVKNYSGKGVSGIVDNRKILVGNLDFLRENNVDFKGKEPDIEAVLSSGKIALFSSIDGILASIITFSDKVRKTSSNLISDLNNKGIDTILLSGDNKASCEATCKDLNLKDIISEASPKEKADYVTKKKQDGTLVMVGDGINDAISLAESDVGISLSGASDIAVNSSSIIVMNDNIYSIMTLLNISKKTIKIIKENIIWAFLYNTIMIFLALGVLSGVGITLNPMIASFFMVLSSITVILNALRIKSVK